MVRKRQRRFEGFDDKTLLYARGMSTRDIEAHLREIYGVSVGRDLISQVTDAVLEDVKAWQQRPLPRIISPFASAGDHSIGMPPAEGSWATAIGLASARARSW